MDRYWGADLLQRTLGFLRSQAEDHRLELPRKGQVRKREMKRFLPAAPIVVEVGAHIGVDTSAMARLWREGRIYAFEPIPNLYRQLVDRVRRYDNVRTYQLALGTHSGEVAMNVSSGRSDGSSSLLTPLEHLEFHPDVTFEETITVHATTLDEWTNEHSVKPDLLWLDAQGAELHILQSATSALSSASAIYTEVSIVENYSGGALYPALVSWLGEHGFKPAIECIPWADGGNVLFSR
jgi:FkbM family methyltransferase